MMEVLQLFYIMLGLIFGKLFMYAIQKRILVVDVSAIDHNIKFNNDCISCK
jgi:hypothetical protein